MNWFWNIIEAIFAKREIDPVNTWKYIPKPLIPNPVPMPPPIKTPEVLKWTTQKECWRSVRLLADEMGLTFPQKNILCATIYQESEFVNYRANGKMLMHPNINEHGIVTSIDFGITQCNDKAHIGPGKEFPSVVYVMNNPEKMVRWMIGIYKQTGGLTPWYGYYDPYKKIYPHKQWIPLTSRMWKLAEI